jgi:hypothetical protein
MSSVPLDRLEIFGFREPDCAGKLPENRTPSADWKTEAK